MSHRSEGGRAARKQRLKWFHGRTAAGEHPTVAVLAEHFGISESTARKDIEALRCQHHAPLVYDREHHGYRYSEPNYQPRFEADSGCNEGGAPVASGEAAVAAGGRTQLTEGELVSILVAELLRKRYHSAGFKDAVQKVFCRLAASLGETVSYDLESLQRIVEFELEPFPSLDFGIFEALVGAMSSRETVVLNYFSGQKAALTRKRCDPLHVINYKDNWYLVAFCHEKQDYRDFLMNRILSVDFTGTHFAPYTGFDIERHKEQSQLFRGMEHPVEVIVEFDKFAAHWIRLRPVHATQRIAERADGSLEISFKVHSHENLLRWVLSFGEHARVLAPLDLQQRVQKTIARMNYLYNRF